MNGPNGMISPWSGATLLLMLQCQWCTLSFPLPLFLGRHLQAHPDGSCRNTHGARHGLDRPLPQSFSDAAGGMVDNGNLRVDNDEACMADSDEPEYDPNTELFRLFYAANNGAGMSKTCIDEFLR